MPLTTRQLYTRFRYHLWTHSFLKNASLAFTTQRVFLSQISDSFFIGYAVSVALHNTVWVLSGSSDGHFFTSFLAQKADFTLIPSSGEQERLIDCPSQATSLMFAFFTKLVSSLSNELQPLNWRAKQQVTIQSARLKTLTQESHDSWSWHYTKCGKFIVSWLWRLTVNFSVHLFVLKWRNLFIIHYLLTCRFHFQSLHACYFYLLLCLQPWAANHLTIIWRFTSLFTYSQLPRQRCFCLLRMDIFMKRDLFYHTVHQ